MADEYEDEAQAERAALLEKIRSARPGETVPLSLDELLSLGDAVPALPSDLGAALSKARQRIEARADADLVGIVNRQKDWSLAVLGPGERKRGLVDHIWKELGEVMRAEEPLEEWIDIVILALDGAWRSGASAEQIVEALLAKQAKNRARRWPDWRTMNPDRAIEHVRDEAGEA
jgi:hypothetical protein